MKKITILKDGSDPIVISGNGERFQLPHRGDQEAEFIPDSSQLPWRMKFSGEGLRFGPNPLNHQIRFGVLLDVLKYIEDHQELPKDNTYIVYEIVADLDTRTIEFDVEINTSPIEIDLESENNIDKESIKNNISSLISYE